MKQPSLLKEMLEDRQIQNEVYKSKESSSGSSFEFEDDALKPTYYGHRKPKSQVIGAKTVYETIKWLDLGSLSAL